MSKQFETKEAFDKWVIDFKKSYTERNSNSLFDQLMSEQPSDIDYISGLIADGYTDLNNLVADGHRYQIGNHTNNGWMYRDEVDVNYVKNKGISVEIRER